MDEDDFQSMSKGVFVIPFDPQAQSRNAAAGPSDPRRLQKLYRASVNHYEHAYRSFEADRIAEQLDNIADWLEQTAHPPVLKLEIPVHRLPVAILQDATTSSSTDLQSLGVHAVDIHGGEAVDLATMTRLITIGLMGEETSASKKTGRAGLDEVEDWYKRKKSKLPLLLYIQDAQMVPPSVLGELMYILTLHPSIPIRLLLSVPSTTHFLSSWTPLDLSTIALSILFTRNRKRNAGIEAILRASGDAPVKISDELAEEIRNEERRAGGGALLAMKAIKWLLLRHSMDSPLARLIEHSKLDEGTMKKVQALVDAVIENPNDPTIPGLELFQLEPHPDLSSVLNPSPRISILHALSNASDFVTLKEDALNNSTKGANERSLSPSPTKTSNSAQQAKPNGTVSEVGHQPRSNKRRRSVADADGEVEGQMPGAITMESREGALKELQVLFEFWKSAGRSVNLWDWLEGFSGSMLDGQSQRKTEDETGPADAEHEEGTKAPSGGGIEHAGSNAIGSGTQTDSADADAQLNGARATESGAENEESSHDRQLHDKHHRQQHQQQQQQHDEEEEARLHATFIRFVEEARMIGLIRARGKGRRADEVLKGVGLA
ncbi:hypothetical protein IAU59_006750 [Kwoniella sp. CBS 9459]